MCIWATLAAWWQQQICKSGQRVVAQECRTLSLLTVPKMCVVGVGYAAAAATETSFCRHNVSVCRRRRDCSRMCLSAQMTHLDNFLCEEELHVRRKWRHPYLIYDTQCAPTTEQLISFIGICVCFDGAFADKRCFCDLRAGYCVILWGLCTCSMVLFENKLKCKKSPKQINLLKEKGISAVL